MTAISEAFTTMMTTREAREATDRARNDAQALWLELYELRQRQAHVALGYATAAEYWRVEFGLGERMAQNYIAAAKVTVAIKANQSGGDTRTLVRVAPPDTERVARVLAPLVESDNGDRVTEAWQVAVEEHSRSETASQPLSAREVKQTLVAKGYLPDTRAGGVSGKPGWFELLGRVGDSLIAARKHLEKADAALTRKPNAKFCAKAREYADWAREIAATLDRIGE